MFSINVIFDLISRGCKHWAEGSPQGAVSPSSLFGKCFHEGPWIQHVSSPVAGTSLLDFIDRDNPLCTCQVCNLCFCATCSFSPSHLSLITWTALRFCTALSCLLPQTGLQKRSRCPVSRLRWAPWGEVTSTSSKFALTAAACTGGRATRAT